MRKVKESREGDFLCGKTSLRNNGIKNFEACA